MKIRQLGILLIVLTFIVACSTEKNTFINRLYHGTTAKYNGLYNANELLYVAMKNYSANKKEDFFNVLPIVQIPNEEEVMGMYPAIDTAIVKCKKVISLHSMPTMDKPSGKTEEYNKWIDENFITIGRAMYYRRDFEESIKNFEFVRKFFRNDPSNYVATLWIARNQLQLGDVGAAKINLDKLDKAAEETASKEQNSGKGNGAEAEKKKKMSAKFKKIQKNKEKSVQAKEEKNGIVFVPFPEKLKYEVELTKGEYFLKKKQYPEAIKALETAAELAHKRDKGRVHFIIGQVAELMKDEAKATENYTAVLKYNTTFDINFTARMNRAMTGGNESIKKDLLKMSRDAKNFEYRDQIFYALGEIDMKKGVREEALANYNKSIFYSINNNRQKARTYERLADINYTDKNYVMAQKYYDSCAKLANDKYPNYDLIVNKASKLKKLVDAIEIAEYEDSVQRIARMSPDEQYKFAENLIKKMKEEEELRQKLALQRQKELSNTGAITGDVSGGKNYFTNQKLKTQGFNDFRKQWGYRENEDDWRRADKISIGNFDNNATAENNKDAKKEEENKPTGPTPEELLANLPTSDSAIAESNSRYVEARYDAGVIYKEQLNENALAAKEFQKILDKNFESDYNPMASFQLYRIFENSDASLADNNKNYILTNYSESDYAAYLRDPNFFVKRKEIEKIYENEYLRYLDRYNRGLYYAVIGKADEVISNEPDNKYRSKYMIMKALSMGQMNSDKSGLVPVLEQVKAEYPSTPEATKAEEMLNIIKNGYSKNEAVDFNKRNIYQYTERGEFWYVIVLDKDQEKQLFNIKNKVADFNKQYFSKNQYTTETKLVGQNNVITVKSTTNLKDAKTYINKFKASSGSLGKTSQADIFFISKENLIKLFENGDINKYLDFFYERY